MLSLRIAEIRTQKNLRQAEVSKYLNISQQTYSSYETGRRQMNYETLCLLADFFEVSADYLLGRGEEMPSYLSGEERALIGQYRTLDGRGRDSVRNCLAFEASRAPGTAKKQAM
ncbi:MAG: helix-turn-helix domain-containing protein [Oscillospiraceae bacterium]|nr:helix-turn-helix domain-containing protein [Oscillospiraceae bacterium]